jgi:RNA polymerase sigma-70 factor (ECF subfamily)
LPGSYRSVVFLVDVLDLDYGEAANILDIPRGTVKSRLARARMRLRRQLLGVDEFIYYYPGLI